MRVSPRPSSTPTSRGSGSGRSTPGLTRGPEEGERAMTYTERLLSSGERIMIVDRQHWFVVLANGRYGIAAIVGALLLFIVQAVARPYGRCLEPARDRGGRAVCRRAGNPAARAAALSERGVRGHEPAGARGERGHQQALGRQLAREDQRRRAEPVVLRPDVRLRRPRYPRRRPKPASTGSGCSTTRWASSGRCSTRSTSTRWTWRRGPAPVSPPLRAGAPGPSPNLLGDTDPDATSSHAVPAAPAPVRPAAPEPVSQTAAPRMSAEEVTRTLASLADLRDRGAISTEEYDLKKADLLGRL